MSLPNFPIIPILVIEDAGWAKELGSCLVESGFPLIEVTLRTNQSWSAVEKMCEVPGIEVGVGSVVSVEDLKRAKDCGAKFAVSPGINRNLLQYAEGLGLPYLPGVATPSEIMTAIELGINILKWFPAETLGGLPALKAISAPFPNIRFVPTGGITSEKASNYLKQDNVHSVGGSWMFPMDLMTKQDLVSLKNCFLETLKGLQA
jgi:2-dehydro-3-deoxyphosphogluconate aldolase / (4S)-4-hydroxy-2-oxoglutarate aldolase